MPFMQYTDEAYNMVKNMCQKCKTCVAKKFFQNSGNYRIEVQEYLQKLYSHYLNEFEELRRLDSTSKETIETLKHNKYLCLDLVDVCKKCDRELDRVNRESMKLKEYKA